MQREKLANFMILSLQDFNPYARIILSHLPACLVTNSPIVWEA
jgi:hypothetical protein